jgi:hypothetical protein
VPRFARSPWPSTAGDSIFAGDPVFRPLKSGKTMSQTTTETVERITRETGKNPGTQRGIARREKLTNRSSNPHLHKTGCK